MTTGSMSKTVNFVWWARDTASPRGLTRAQRAVLKELASRANRDGCCDPSIDTIADGVAFSPGHTKRVVHQLETLGLVRSRRRGRGCTSVRQLCPDAPMPAPLCPCGTRPLFGADLQPVAATSEASEVSSEASEVSSDETQKYQLEETECVSARTPDHSSAVLSASLQAVMAILQEAGDQANVDAASVDCALRRFPDGEHAAAAGFVLTQLLSPDCRCRAASVLLHRELERRDRDARRPPVSPSRRPTVRRRGSPPDRRPLTAEGRRWGPVPGGKFDVAAGLTT